MAMKETNRKEEKAITVGSGTAYLLPFEGELPSMESREEIMALCTEQNRMGYTKGGATVTYSKETGELSDDLGKIHKVYMQSDSAKLKLGLFAWNGKTLERIEATARVEERNGLRITKIGGLSNDDGKQYALIFHHEDKQDGDCWWVLVGKNTAGLELAYAVDDGTKVEPEFTAVSQDKDGTLITFIEEIEVSVEDPKSDDGEDAKTGTDEGGEVENAG